ncbi:MAG: glycosyltransferase family 39 protein [Halioglobus sp.]|nr:glycosyltransferase family 39 protein [Halioglobus sp.]
MQASNPDTPAQIQRLPGWLAGIRFGPALLVSLAVGGLIRLLYVLLVFGATDPALSGDGVGYHFDALRLADGLGYTAALWDVGAESAHHPPGWVTLLAGVSALGFDTIHEHQLLGVLIGMLVIGVSAVIGRLFFGDLAGAAAGAIAAVYPGFWVLDAQILSEPLALVLLGASIIALYQFSRQPDVRHALVFGVFIGLTTLTRPEQLALLVFLLPALWRARQLSYLRRAMLALLVFAVVTLLITPWAVYNANRFDVPVLISANMGTGLLVGNCAKTFSGEKRGFYHMGCLKHGMKSENPGDSAMADRRNLHAAIDQIRSNLDKLPMTIVARYGRAFGLYRTDHTVTEVAKWHGTAKWPVWAWVISFWFVAVLAIVGATAAIRARIDISPLAISVLIMLGVVGVFYGEPRYHTMADLSLVVLAGFGLVKICLWKSGVSTDLLLHPPDR